VSRLFLLIRLAIQNRSHTIQVPPDMLSTGEHFALEVRGDSMVEAGILDGERLYFTLGRELAFGGVSIPRPSVRGRARRHKSVGRLRKDDLHEALERARTRTEVDLTRIARDIAVAAAER